VQISLVRGKGKGVDNLKKVIDDRTHPYGERRLDRDKSDRGIGGESERGLDYQFRGFNCGVPKPSSEQFDQWALEEPDLLRGSTVATMVPPVSS
jgi:hypothetical protein